MSSEPNDADETDFARFEHTLGSSRPTPKIPGYDIVSMLGAGGMGTVWRARQRGTGRDVALKLLTDRPTDARAPARFIREVELASCLEHPNIARVYESGVHDGKFYYAMELVKGVPLDLWARQNSLGEREILGLMQTVCDAVQHAHFKGIIHRDLKPSNILVAQDGQPRLLDFGLARPITPGAAAVVSDDRGAVAGTPAYMSPEQAASRCGQVDTRSDVYGLGKILYELLLGRPAHDLDGTQFDLWKRVVEEDVRRPREVNSSINPDLEAVLLKALDRDPRNRYASAGDLGADLKNVLCNEPVSARPATLSYFVGKKLSRHRSVVLAVAGVTLALAGLSIFSVARISRERQRAIHEAAKANAVTHFYQDVMEAQDPANARGVNNVDQKIMNRADGSLAEAFADDRVSEASIRGKLGEKMFSLGRLATANSEIDQARKLLIQAAENHDPRAPESEVLATTDLLAQVLRERGNVSGAEGLIRSVIDRYKALFGEHDPLKLAAMGTLSNVQDDLGRRDEAEATARAALRLAGGIADPEDLTTARATPVNLDLASALTRRLSESLVPDKIAEADAWARKIRDIWLSRVPQREVPSIASPTSELPADRHLLEAEHDLASVLNCEYKWDEAIELHRAVIARGRAVLGADHPDLLIWRNNYACALAGRGRAEDLKEAEEIFRELLLVTPDVRGSLNRDTVNALDGLAEVLRGEGKDATNYEQLVDSYSSLALDRLPQVGTQNLQALFFLDMRAQSLFHQKKFDAAETVYKQALKVRETVLGTKHQDTLKTKWKLGVLYTTTGDNARARKMLSDTLVTCVSVLPKDHLLIGWVQKALEDALKAVPPK